MADDNHLLEVGAKNREAFARFQEQEVRVQPPEAGFLFMPEMGLGSRNWDWNAPPGINPDAYKHSKFCEWCANPFTRERRSLAEVNALRQVVKIPMTTPYEPPICDNCYAGVMGSAVPEPEVKGEKPPFTSLGFPNMLLRPKE